jgi:hypothetical protein
VVNTIWVIEKNINQLKWWTVCIPLDKGDTRAGWLAWVARLVPLRLWLFLLHAVFGSAIAFFSLLVSAGATAHI